MSKDLHGHLYVVSIRSGQIGALKLRPNGHEYCIGLHGFYQFRRCRRIQPNLHAGLIELPDQIVLVILQRPLEIRIVRMEQLSTQPVSLLQQCHLMAQPAAVTADTIPAGPPPTTTSFLGLDALGNSRSSLSSKPISGLTEQ